MRQEGELRPGRWQVLPVPGTAPPHCRPPFLMKAGGLPRWKGEDAGETGVPGIRGLRVLSPSPFRGNPSAALGAWPNPSSGWKLLEPAETNLWRNGSWLEKTGGYVCNLVSLPGALQTWGLADQGPCLGPTSSCCVTSGELLYFPEPHL